MIVINNVLFESLFDFFNEFSYTIYDFIVFWAGYVTDEFGYPVLAEDITFLVVLSMVLVYFIVIIFTIFIIYKVVKWFINIFV